MNTHLVNKFVALDLETTDIDPARGEIIEVSVVLFENGREKDSFTSFVKPTKSIPSLITSITGITDQDVKDAPTFSAIKDKVAEKIADHPIVGHNIAFDLGFLAANNLKLTSLKAYDTFQLATILLPNAASYSLETLADRFNISYPESHRAYHDSVLGAKFFIFLQDRLLATSPEALAEIKSLNSKTKWPGFDLFIKAVDYAKQKTKKHPPKPAQKPKKSPKKPSHKSKIDFEVEKIAHFFESPKSPLAQKPSFELRPAQAKMARAISRTLEKGERIVIEAGPATGKSFAYLTPAAYFSRAHSSRVTISVATFELEQQIVKKDIPFLKDHLPLPFTFYNFRGRDGYICLDRFRRFLAKERLNPAETIFAVKLIIWLHATKTGALSEVSLSFDERRFVDQINSSTIACSEKTCRRAAKNECFFQNALAQSKSADILLINHSLLLSNELEGIAIKNLIADEAAALERAASLSRSEILSQKDINTTLEVDSGTLKVNLQDAKVPKARISSFVKAADETANKTALFFGLVGLFAKKYSADQQFPQVTLDNSARAEIMWSNLEEAATNLLLHLKQLQTKIRQFNQSSKTKSKKIPEAEILIHRIQSWGSFLKETIFTPQKNFVYWFSADERNVLIRRAPINSAPILKKIFKPFRSTALVASNVSVKNDLSFFKSQIGADDFRDLQIEPALDYKNQTLIIIPKDIKAPNDPSYHKESARIIKDITLEQKGRTTALFTSKSAIKSVYKDLWSELSEAEIDVLAQNVTGSRQKIIEKAGPSTLILSTYGFWEGIKVPKPNASCLILTRLPFEMPFEPVVKARHDQIADSFKDYAIPRAIIGFKQGFEKLAPNKNKKSVLIILDQRIVSQNYGEDFLQSLPKTSISITDQKKVLEETVLWLTGKEPTPKKSPGTQGQLLK